MKSTIDQYCNESPIGNNFRWLKSRRAYACLQVAAASGYKVTLVDVNNDLVQKAQANIKNSLARVAKKQFKDDASAGQQFVDATLDRLTGSSDLNTTVKSTDLVIEAIVENIGVKHELFSSIDKVNFDVLLKR